MAPWVISHFPPHRVYVEPFGGAASVLMCKPPSHEEVYNDLDREVVNVFRVLRDPAKAHELERRLSLTPYAREEFVGAYEVNETDDDIELARKKIIKSAMSYGIGGINRASYNGFRSRRGEQQYVSKDWMKYPSEIRVFVERLQGVVIENRDAVLVIQKYDSPDTLHYIDPPYLPITRTEKGQVLYKHEMTEDEHVALASTLQGLTGMVVLSGYESDLYADLYPSWQTISRKSWAMTNVERRECLWISPAASERMAQRNLFEGEEAAS